MPQFSDRAKAIWGVPKKRGEQQLMRKVSWLELFFDLVYAAAISQLAHLLSSHSGLQNLVPFLVLFCFVFWAWTNGSAYHDLHGSDGIRSRYFTLMQMLGMAAVTVTLKDAFEGHIHSFIIAFTTVQLLITWLWWSTGYYDPSHKAFNRWYVFNYGLAAILLMVSAFTSAGVSNILMGLVLVLNFTPGIIANRLTTAELEKRGEVFITPPSLIERFGLFTIIVLAETIFGAVNGLSGLAEKDTGTWCAFVLAIVIAFLLWWIYFDLLGDQEAKPGPVYFTLLVFLHLPLLAALGVTGASINLLLSHTGGAGPMVHWLFCCSVAVLLLCISALTHIMEMDAETKSYAIPVARLLGASSAALLAVPFFSSTLSAAAFLGLAAVILILPVFSGIKNWIAYALGSRPESA